MPIDISQTINEQIKTLSEATISDVDLAKELFVDSHFKRDLDIESPISDEQRKKFEYTAEVIEIFGSDLLSRYYKDEKIVKKAWHELLWSAFRIRRGLKLLGQVSNGKMMDQIFDGLLANRHPEMRLELEKFDLYRNSPENLAWDAYVFEETKRAFLLLVRKKGGYEDITHAISVIRNLQSLQEGKEKEYLTPFVIDKEDSQMQYQLRHYASRLVALYNLARAVEVTGLHISGGQKALSARGLKGEIDRFIFNAREVLSGGFDPELRIFSGKIGEGCKALIDSSIFSVVAPSKIRQFLEELSRTHNRPVLELWYSQREALRQSLLDPTKTATVISMPTSSGKTLLAELAILQAYYDNPDSRIVYLAPTKALVSQISLTLKRHLGKYLEVRTATPTFELNPVEIEVLKGSFNVLVTTPEKMDLLVRIKHEAVQRLSLVVIDEAHTINDGERGARLELLLATLRREEGATRFLLLTPFARNASDVAYWLGEDHRAPIIIDWKPNDRVVGCLRPGKKVRGQKKREMTFDSLSTVHSDCPDGKIFSMGLFAIDLEDIDSKERLCLHSAMKWARTRGGGILLLASSRPKAEERARFLASQIPEKSISKSLDLACRYIEAELGTDNPLTGMLKKGVAFHHAGLSPETRFLIERLVEEKEIKILCATTTLAQGVNFPLSVAIIEEFTRRVKKKGQWERKDLQPWEFWNIAGRVGRTFEDSLGVVAFSAATKKQVDNIQQYLKKDSLVISSALIGLIRKLQGNTNIKFNTDLVEEVDSASAFMQYIVHALAVSDLDKVRKNIEGILRASFVYEEARSIDPKLADELIRISRAYLDQLEERKGKALKGFASLADGTGFSSPSVDVIWSKWKIEKQKQKQTEWEASKLFPSDSSVSETLVEAIKTINRIPEIKLSSENINEFSPERIARIASSWVNGKSLQEISEQEYNSDIIHCVYHLYGKISNLLPWGIRGIQRVAFSGEDNIDWSSLDLIPAMLYHGVDSKEAIALRMQNVPRFAVGGLAEQWRQSGNESLQDTSEWLSTLPDTQWSNALSKNIGISGRECKMVWQVLEGKRAWAELETNL